MGARTKLKPAGNDACANETRMGDRDMAGFGQRFRLAAYVAGGTLLALARVTPADVMATTLDPVRLADPGFDGTAKFETGPVFFMRH